MSVNYGYILNEDGTTTPQADPGAVQRGEKVEIAADSEKLGGKPASDFVQTSNVLTLEEIKASTDLTGKIPAASAVLIKKLVKKQSVSVSANTTYTTQIDYEEFGIDTTKILFSDVYWSNSANDIPATQVVKYFTVDKPYCYAIQHKWTVTQTVSFYILILYYD